MVALAVEGGDLVVRLSRLEKLGSFRGDVRVPLASVVEVGTVVPGTAGRRGGRMLGTGVPGLISLGSYRGRHGRDFCALYRRRPAVVVDLAGASWDRLVLAVADPDAAAADLRARLPR